MRRVINNNVTCVYFINNYTHTSFILLFNRMHIIIIIIDAYRMFEFNDSHAILSGLPRRSLCSLLAMTGRAYGFVTFNKAL